VSGRDLGRGLPGLVVAGITAVVSGVAVFVNSYAVHSVQPPAVYTTAKNLVAAFLLLLVSGVAGYVRQESPMAARWITAPRGGAGGSLGPTARVMAALYVGVVGGGIAFILFFDGLAESAATPAAFLHSSLVVFVAVLAWPVLRERPTLWNLAAIVALVWGQAALAGGVSGLALRSGQMLVLSATLLWAVEVVLAKRLLADLSPGALAVLRMGVGSVVLVGYLGLHHELRLLGSLSGEAVGWVLLTGLILAVYVATWMTALSRARALDVTSVLVGAALVTALLQAAAGTKVLHPEGLGLVLVALGTAAVLWSSWARRRAAT